MVYSNIVAMRTGNMGTGNETMRTGNIVKLACHRCHKLIITYEVLTLNMASDADRA